MDNKRFIGGVIVLVLLVGGLFYVTDLLLKEKDIEGKWKVRKVEGEYASLFEGTHYTFGPDSIFIMRNGDQLDSGKYTVKEQVLTIQYKRASSAKARFDIEWNGNEWVWEHHSVDQVFYLEPDD